MALTAKTLSFLAWSYTISSFVLLLVFGYATFTGKFIGGEARPILGIAGILMLMVVHWMFYVRWFVADSQFSYPVWPPYYSACPDYLTFMGQSPKNGKAMCVDFVGVVRRDGMKKSDPLLPPRPEETDYIFLTNPADSTNKKCNDALGRGLSWSGITAGSGCA
jgi:hypothetical protein